MPPPPAPAERPATGWRRVLAIVGIVGGFLFFIVPGFFALRSYRRWREGDIRTPKFAWSCAATWLVWIGLSVWASIAFPDQLIDVDFANGLEPFVEGSYEHGDAEHVEGTYRITNARTDVFAQSFGDLPRPVNAVGVRAEFERLSEPGTQVGVRCMGPSNDGTVPIGYGFFAEPGGGYALMLFTPDEAVTLQEGDDAPFEALDRVSITCEPTGIAAVVGGSSDVRVTGSANGEQVVSVTDHDGVTEYTAVALVMGGDRFSAEVRFTRVSARVPDEGWVP
ncbi:MAG TPA: hypothetical protein VFR44_00210 [Actinomycetota bacterium]|nr:hypothetical protein [Actinomycetota bacterium]